MLLQSFKQSMFLYDIQVDTTALAMASWPDTCDDRDVKRLCAVPVVGEIG